MAGALLDLDRVPGGGGGVCPEGLRGRAFTQQKLMGVMGSGGGEDSKCKGPGVVRSSQQAVRHVGCSQRGREDRGTHPQCQGPVKERVWQRPMVIGPSH